MGKVMKHQEECQQGRDPIKDTVATERVHMSIQVGEVQIMENEEGMEQMEK